MKLRGFGRATSRVCVAAILWCGGFVAVSADENLLGLPESIDANKPGAVMLHGGGQITDDAFEEFIERAGGSEARLVFVPSAGYSVGSYADEEEFLDVVSNRYGGWSALAEEGRIRDFCFLYTDESADADDAEFTKPLETATGVWFSGGHQARLNEKYVGEWPTKTRFQELVRKVVERGGIVGGTSAGMAAMPEVMTLWEDRAMTNAPAVAVTAHGFGLLTKAVVEQHFDARGGRFERFFQLLRDDARIDALTGRPGSAEEMVGLAVEEDTAIVAERDRLNVLGNGKAHVFLKSEAGRAISWKELRSGESARLRRDVPKPTREQILLVEDRKVDANTTASSE